MNKFSKIWFDENLGEFQRQEIPYASVFLKPEELAASKLNGLRLTREELVALYNINLVTEPAKPEIWYGMDWAQPDSDRMVAWHGSRHVDKALVLANIQRAIGSLNDPHPYHVTADLYDRMKAEGMALGGVTRMEPHRYEFQRPPTAAKTRAALHPLVGALIDRLNEKN